MKSATHRANLAAAIVALLGVILAWVGSTLSEGQFICISKMNLIWLSAVMGGISRVVGILVRGKNGESS